MAHAHPTSPRGPSAPGQLLAVIGPPSPTAAVARRAATAASARHPTRSVLLVDLTRTAVLGPDPGGAGLRAVVEACRFGAVDRPAVAAASVPADAGYRIVPGWAHPLDWTTLPLATAELVVDTLERQADVVVVAVDPDLEGEAETGSIDIEERHALARIAVRRASAVAIAGDRDEAGRTLAHRLGTEAARRAPAGAPVATFAADGVALGSATPVRHRTIGQLLAAMAPTDRTRTATTVEPERIVPGDLGLHREPRPSPDRPTGL